MKKIAMKLLLVSPLAFLVFLWLYFYSPDSNIVLIVAVVCIFLGAISGILIDKFYVKK